jgi:prevent-host-death family protein
MDFHCSIELNAFERLIMINVKSIQSLTDFKRNTNQYLKELRKSRRPLVLTVNGKAELVVFDADSFENLMNKIEYADAVRDIREGIESFEKGEGKPANEALAELAKKYDIPD